ncbi:GNAT family N-acetyltransferase [Streptomyces sp. UNOC14_S4]|uniref:GNAT family N-acetyltransferase n=1 Tax=Streptomyces sp. UNOC14_S4 TaxID=2872340 RepID=UPI001E38B966|nr:GNAT family N-acetyltransferase [Streptomyces sp. UNOC14_S4]MCC3766384.1 GNAT family N-acetyltransferase [Streptomyces sp. UNOC14_S4]
MVHIERATERDAEAIAILIGEIEAYYGGEKAPADVTQVRTLLFGEQPAATVLLARDGDIVLGMASYSFLWPAAGADASLFLKELFVRESARRQGIATALMTRVQTAASAAGCTRVEWTADRNNSTALDFYKALGAEPHHDKMLYRIE